MKILVIIPAYNEGDIIYQVVTDIKKNNEENVDIVVVNDGSIDNTSEEAKRAGATVLDLPVNLGIGGAVQTGYLYAHYNNYDMAVQVDGDGQHDSKYIKEMSTYIQRDKYDMVIGSRFVEKTTYKQTFMRLLGCKLLSFVTKMLTGKRIYDTTSGFRMVNKGIIEIFVKNYPHDYPEPETNMQMILKKKKIIEIPTQMYQRQTGESFVSPLKSVTYMTKVCLAMFVARIRKN